MTNTLFLTYSLLALLVLLTAAGGYPFTLLFARLGQSAAVRATQKFNRINVLLSYAWAATLLIGAGVAWYASGGVWEHLAPLTATLAIGITITIAGIKLLPQYVAETSKFESCRMLFELMPHGICRRYAKALRANAIVQFELYGAEPIEGYLTVRGTQCRFDYGMCPEPTVTVKCDSQLWLAIANGEADPIGELLAEHYTLQGNASIMPHLSKLFHTGWHVELPTSGAIGKRLYKEYAQLKPVKIRKVVIFYSGKRSVAFSKTLFMAEHLASGIRQAGGEVELINLWEKRIGNCMGCYHCWTKTPGRCIINDDMGELLQKYLEADLAVFASPLYIFSVNGVMKTFMDRFLPLFQPYMELLPDGHTAHPFRHIDASPTHTLVVSAGGFPDVEGNFSPLRELFNQWTAHLPHTTLRGELLLPAAEMIAMPSFEDRKNAIAACCKEVGRELIDCGCPSVKNLSCISSPGVSSADFQYMANVFWESMDGKKAYIQTMNKLKP